MLKNNKGITMIALIVTVIALLILASITTYSGIGTVEKSRYYEALSEMKIMQSTVNEWYEYYKHGENSGWDEGEVLAGTGVESQALTAYNSAKKNNLNSEDIGEISDYKYFSIECINEILDIDGIQYDFIININTRTVILIDGIENEGVTYYSLGEIYGEQYNVKYTNDI